MYNPIIVHPTKGWGTIAYKRRAKLPLFLDYLLVITEKKGIFVHC